MKKILFILTAILCTTVLNAKDVEPCLILTSNDNNATELITDINATIKACTQAIKESPDESLYAYTLGNTYLEENNYEQAFKWLSNGAEQGNTEAQNKLGDMYYFGEGIKKDYKQAFKWNIKAAEKGDADAQFRIGMMYNRGEWATVNVKKSFKWLMKSAKQNHAAAQSNIASAYDYGSGVKKDYEKAFEWSMKAIKQNDRNAHNSMARRYHIGRGVQKNYKKAYEWYLKAAKLGDVGSLNQLGILYFLGKGVQKNYIKSYAYFSLYLKSDYLHSDNKEDDVALKPLRDEINKILDFLEKKMTSQQIDMAQNYDPLKNNNKVTNKSSTKEIEPSQTYTGTGFFVDKSIVLTNHHVVRNCKSIELIRNGYTSSAKIKAKDTINDLAILEADKTNSSSLNFRAGKGIRIGNDIIVIGYPLGYLLGSGIKLTTGNVSALNGLINDTTQMQLTAPVQPGNSGGALLDESGNVVGVIVARLKKEQNVNLAIKSNIAQMFLDVNNIDYGVAMSKDKKDVADIADEAKESIVQVLCHQ